MKLLALFILFATILFLAFNFTTEEQTEKWLEGVFTSTSSGKPHSTIDQTINNKTDNKVAEKNSTPYVSNKVQPDTTRSTQEIYTWVDEKGTIYYSDKAHSSEAKVIDIPDNESILIHNKTYEQKVSEQKLAQRIAENSKFIRAKKTSPPAQKKSISEKDYRISTLSVGKLGNNVISISGRVGDGPVCNDMEIIAHARNENGLSASVRTKTRLSNSYGSTVFNGSKKVYGSAEDRSFWEVDRVIVRCYD